MSENSSEDLRRIVERLEQLSSQLLGVLERERQALVQRALVDLEPITTDKAELCATIDAVSAELGPTPLRQQIAALPAAHRATLEVDHERLLELVQRTRECNAVNGKVLRRSQQSVREMMHLMSGTDTDALYSDQGYTEQGRSSTRSPSTAIAKA